MKRMKTGKQILKRFLSFVLAVIFMLSPCGTAFAATEGDAAENTSSIAEVKQIAPSEMKEGGYYVLAMSGVSCAYNNTVCLHADHAKENATYAMSCQRNNYDYETNGGAFILDHEIYDGSVAATSENLIWKYEKCGDGYSFQAYSQEGSYLNIVPGDSKADLILGAQQALMVNVGNSAIQISSAGYNVRFTTASGCGFQAGTAASSVDFNVYEVIFTDNSSEGGEDTGNNEGGQDTGNNGDNADTGNNGNNGNTEGSTEAAVTAVTEIAPAEMENGGYYVFAMKKINCGSNCLQGHGDSGKTFALSNNCNPYDYAANGGKTVLDHVEFDGTVAAVTKNIIWKYETYDDGFSLKAYSVDGEESYLNITEGDGTEANAALGARQALDIHQGASTVQVSSGGYYLRFTGARGGGYEADTAKVSIDFYVYEVSFEADSSDENTGNEEDEAVIRQISPQEIQSGGEYIFAATSIQDSYGVGKTPALSNLGNGYDTNNVRIASPFDGTVETAYDTVIWTVEAYEDGHSLKAYSVEGVESYLNITGGDGTEAALSLGAKQALTLEVSGNTVTISRNIGGVKYYLRFTGGHGTGFEADKATSSNTFYVYAVNPGKIPSVPDVEEERETPLYTIAALADMHIDYGLQNNENVIREVTQEALRTIKEKENPDMVIAGGDMTSTNGGTAAWDQTKFNKSIQQMTDALSAASKNGKVLYVNGNHDYEVGGTAYNSGAYIDDEMKETVGSYVDALYESEARKSNLLAYYYKIDGIHYIGLNTPYNGDKTVSGYTYTKESIDWVEKTLKGIPEDELIIFMAHYMLQDSRGTTGANKGLSNNYESNTRLKNILLNYPNLIYLYGHDHGGPFIEKDTFERVTAYNADGTIETISSKRANSFTSSFVGSLSYYMNRYNSGWLGADQPKVVQVLMIYVYQDHVELQMKNYGEETGVRKYPSSYSIALLKQMTSDVYEVDNAKKLVSGVAHNTTVADFLENFDDAGMLRVIGFDGNVITDTTREVRSDMKVQYVQGDTVQSELTIRVDQAAESDMPYTVKSVTLKNENGKQVYGLRMARNITDITVEANTENPGKAIAFIGLYDTEGQLLRSALTDVNGSGTYTISLPLADLPEDVVWRAVVYKSLSIMCPASYPLTSDEDRYALANTAVSAETELVAGVDQMQNKLVVFKQSSENWNEEASVVWKWQPTAALGFDNASSFRNASDAKLRYSDYYGGYVVIATSSGCFVGIADYETGESLYSRNTAYSGNLHAIELLPDGNIVTAGSSGNAVTIFAASQGDGNGYYKKYNFEDAHGLLWDPDLQVLWALGGQELTAYKVTGTQEEPTLEQQTDLTVPLPSTGGHDLYPVYGAENKLWVTTVSGLYQFDTDTRLFQAFHNSAINAANIKSIGNQPYSGTIVRAVMKGTLYSWCTDTIELFVPQPDNTYQSVNKVVTSDAYYKDRVWYYKYQ